jgi:hypothetical protein
MFNGCLTTRSPDCHRWTAPEDTRVVTVPIGYGDGFLPFAEDTLYLSLRGHMHQSKESGSKVVY